MRAPVDHPAAKPSSEQNSAADACRDHGRRGAAPVARLPFELVNRKCPGQFSVGRTLSKPGSGGGRSASRAGTEMHREGRVDLGEPDAVDDFGEEVKALGRARPSAGAIKCRSDNVELLNRGSTAVQLGGL